VVKKYYYAGGVRVAENNGGTLYFLLSDHLGSTAVTTDASGVRVTELRYYPYGDSERYNPGGQITTFRFTGQRWDPGTGLYWYNSRWYDPLIGRFIQADTIVPQPGNPQNLNRYSYVRNNPLRYTDPSGHWPIPPRFPIEQVIFRILNDPYVKPLWQNPQIGAPVLYSAYREAKGDAPEALSLTLDWYFERGEAPRDIGSDSEITQFLITSRGVQEAREQFAKGGGQDMTLAAKNAAHHEFTWEAVPELYKALRYDDWCGSFLGSFDVEFENLQGYDGPGKLVAVRVINDTGWQSATKIPFTQRTTRQNVDRSDPGPGGTLLQYYRWWEIIDVE
jgi:RHS repeat-associated protein